MERLKSKKAFSILEALFANIIILLALSGSMVFNEPLRYLMNQVERRFTAVNLATSQLEHLQAIANENYASQELQAANGTPSTAVASALIPEGFEITNEIIDRTDWPEDDTGSGGTDIDGPEYKEINVCCKYPLGSKSKAVQLKLKGFVVKK